jgi:Ca2+-binding EF-hand superfamily protein
MTRDDYTKYNEKNWNDMGVKEIDKNHPQYSAFQKSSRFRLMDKNNDGAISRDEYMAFYDDAWNKMKRRDPNVTYKEEFEQSVGDTNNPLHPQYKRP